MPSKSIFFLFVIAICVIFLVSYAFTGSFAFWNVIARLGPPTGILRIQSQPPVVQDIYLINYTEGTIWRCDPVNEGVCSMTIDTLSLNHSYVINATIYAQNGDCDTWPTGNVHASVCNQTFSKSACNENIDIYDVVLGSPTKFGTGGVYCNYTGKFGMEYFRRYGSWRINVTAINGQNQANSIVRNATYVKGVQVAYPYPAGSNIDLGTISSFDSFSVGRGANTTRNLGNIRANFTWNTTSFSCGGAAPYIYIINSPYNNFAIGNESNMVGPNNNNYTFINANPTITGPFYPAGGMRRCGTFTCDRDENLVLTPGNLANYTIYWHINVSSGTLVCTTPYYSNVIQQNVYYDDREG